jgi:hypothetical protein
MYTPPSHRVIAITFVLAGRTTFSEHCPTEHIDVDYAIAERSPYLRIYLPQHVRDAQPLLPIQLGYVDPAGFKLYIEWLTTGTVHFSSKRSLRLDSCIDLIYAHIVGYAFSQPHFQDYIIDTLAYVLDPAQSFDQKILEMLFLEKHASVVLRQFVTDRMFAYERRMLGMIRNAVEDIVTGSSDVKGCEYHVHEDGVCYKHGRADEAEEAESNNGVGGKKWSIDDDPELNAMAAQYLGKTNTPSPARETSPIGSRKIPKTQQHSPAPQHKKPSLHSMNISTSHHQPSILWSRNLRSPQPSIRSLTPTFDIDKPLPPTPEAVQTPSTQDLVLECLGRLSPAPSRNPTLDLLNEHLSRLPLHVVPPPSPPATPSPKSSDMASTPSSTISSTTDCIPPSLRPGSPPSTHPTRNLTFAPCPNSKPVSPDPYTNLHRQSPLSPPSPPPLQRPYHMSPTSPSLPHFPPLIKRKPAPPRGLDWLEQWDRLFALQGTQGFGLRKGEKKERRSWFVEILGSVMVDGERGGRDGKGRGTR